MVSGFHGDGYVTDCLVDFILRAGLELPRKDLIAVALVWVEVPLTKVRNVRQQSLASVKEFERRP